MCRPCQRAVPGGGRCLRIADPTVSCRTAERLVIDHLCRVLNQRGPGAEAGRLGSSETVFAPLGYGVFGTGTGYDVQGAAQHVHGSEPTINEAILPLVVANDAKLVDGKVVGDPTEGAFLVLAAKARLDANQTRACRRPVDPVGDRQMVRPPPRVCSGAVAGLNPEPDWATRRRPGGMVGRLRFFGFAGGVMVPGSPAPEECR